MIAVQCKMARAALGWGVRELAEAAKVSPDTVARFERGDALRERTVDALRTALEAAGVIFVAENGEGPGVRLRKNYPDDTSERGITAEMFQLLVDRFRRNHVGSLHGFLGESWADFTLEADGSLTQGSRVIGKLGFDGRKITYDPPMPERHRSEEHHPSELALRSWVLEAALGLSKK